VKDNTGSLDHRSIILVLIDHNFHFLSIATSPASTTCLASLTVGFHSFYCRIRRCLNVRLTGEIDYMTSFLCTEGVHVVGPYVVNVFFIW